MAEVGGSAGSDLANGSDECRSEARCNSATVRCQQADTAHVKYATADRADGLENPSCRHKEP